MFGLFGLRWLAYDCSVCAIVCAILFPACLWVGFTMLVALRDGGL